MCLLSVLDASSKVEPGFYDMKWQWNPGSEDSCLKIDQMTATFSLFRIEVPETPKYSQIFEKLYGNDIAYSMKNVNRARRFLGFFHGICHPSKCSAHDVGTIINFYFGNDVSFTVQNQNRRIKSKTDTFQYVAIIFLLGILLMNIISTLKYYFFESIPIGHKSFDMVSNVKTFLKFSSYDNITTRIFNGFKFWYLFLSILGHMPVSISGPLGPFFNEMFNLSKYYPKFVHRVLRFAVDGVIFNFVLTGAISTISWFPYFDSKNGLVTFWFFLMVRALRLLPIIIVVIAIIVAAPVINFLNSGIVFNPLINQMSHNCKTFGWSEILFLGNYVHCTNMCNAVGWFLSADFQLNIICFPLMKMLHRSMKNGTKLALVYIFGAILLQYIISYTTYEGYVVPTYENLDSYEFLTVNHFWTTNYISSYVLGLILGCAIYRDVRISDNISTSKISYILSVLFVLQIIYTCDINYWNDGHMKMIIAVLSRTSSGLIMATGIYLSWNTSTTNTFRRMMSSQFYDYVGKFLLPAYLVHIPILVWLTAYSRNESLDPGPCMNQFIGKGIFVLMLSLIVGFILHILVEIPSMKLIKSIFSGKQE